MNDREKCLREACEIVNGARNQTYGNVDVAGYAACAYEITKKWNGESDDSNRENLVRAN